MKTKIKIYSVSLFLLLTGAMGVKAQITIGSSSEPHKSAILDLKSTTKGLLLPNVALNNADLTQFILDEETHKGTAQGMLVYNTTDDKVYFWDGAKWNPLSGTGGSTGEEPTIATVECAGLTFMDRNLGAGLGDPRPETYDAGDDTNPTGYLNGDYYQWGRQADGHEKWNSPVADEPASLSDIDDADNGQVRDGNAKYGHFIWGIYDSNYDWRITQNDNLWNETGTGLVNPCPTGFRIPTILEWEAVSEEITSANRSAMDSTHEGIYVGSSALFLPAAGVRDSMNGVVSDVGFYASYWSSTVDDVIGRGLYFGSRSCGIQDYDRAYGLSVRCIKK